MTCGSANATKCATSVYVSQFGSDYLIGFRGEVNEDPAAPRSEKTIDLFATRDRRRTANDLRARRGNGINYYGAQDARRGARFR